MIPIILLAAHIATSPDLGKAEGQCRPNEQGPALLVDVSGLRDRKGTLKIELYPPNDKDFLQDDNILVMAGKTFRRAEIPVPQSGPAQLCIRAPGPGTYAVALLHDRDSNHKFGLSVDGLGTTSNRRVCWGQPKAKQTLATVGAGPTRIAITMMYRSGLVCFAPLK